MRTFALVASLLIILVASVWWATSVWMSVEGPPMPPEGYVAMWLGIAFSLVIGSDTSMSNQRACMYWVFIFIAEEKIGGFQPSVESRAEASRAWCVPKSGSSCLPTEGAGANPES